MSPAENFKKKETIIVEKIIKILRITAGAIVNFFRMILQKGKQRFTVMFIPHSEKKILNFHVSVFSLVFLTFLLFVIILGFFYLATYFTGSEAKVDELTYNLDMSTRNLERYRDEIKKFSRTIKTFKKSMENILGVIKGESFNTFQQKGEGGDLSSMSPYEGDFEGENEIWELQTLTAYINNAITPLEEIKDVLLQQKNLLVDIPNLWPVYGGRDRRVGNITDIFGPGKHPLTGKFRIHKGVDIAWSSGTPIVATANGVIRGVDYNPTGLGHYITIQHKYGFFTRYGHLQKALVTRGQKISRGDIIGYMGSTGLSTGPHLHYEIWMGIQVVDPMQYLDIDHVLIEKYK
ncbi:MAG: M23 family metallopeptidase [Spirochaetales bacterium]|nr:M23 family metallopeptidase [Spirochaetales bacterium]